MNKNYIINLILKLQISMHLVLIGLIVTLITMFNNQAYGQAAVYTAETFNANIPGYPNWTAGASFKTPTVDWSQGKISGGGVAPNDFQWVNAGANPAAANQNIAGFPAGAGFMRYVNRTLAYPAISGAPNGDAAFVATRSLDWSGHTTYNAVSDTFGISVWRDNTAAALAVLDYIEVYVNTQPSLSGAVLASTTGGANRIHRSSTQTPVAVTPNAWNRYQFVIPNDARFYGPLFPGACGTSNAYIIIAGFSAGGNNIFIDNINMPQWQTQMVVTAANVFITQNADVGKNSLDNLMLGVQITTKGSLTPRRLDGILFNTQGSSAFSTDVTQPSGAKCWFTGGSSTFATAGGSVSVPKVAPTNATYTNAQLYFGFLDAVAGCPTGLTTALYNFTPGNENFVWLAYDIPTTAQAANFVAGGFEQLFTGWSAPGAAGCFSDTVITSAGIQTPVSFAAFVPSPSISAIRQIDQAYNIPTYSVGTSFPSGGYTNNDFISGVFFPGDNSTKIDNYNHDVSCTSCIAASNLNCERVACHPPDYTQFKPVNLGTYQERVVQVTQGKGVRNGTPPYAVKAQCGTWFSANTVAIFIDWNKDGDFDDRYSGTGGFIYENYGSQQQTQASMALPAVWGANTSWNISVPLPTDVVTDGADPSQPNSPGSNNTGPIIVGNVRMRVREIFAAPNSVAGVIGVHPTNSGFTFGEVEDYTIQVLPDCPLPGSNVCKWVGATNDWNNPSNWCPALPTKNDIAYIAPGPLFPPTILDSTNAECRTLQIMPGANVVIDATKGSSLKVYDDVIIGQGATIGTGSSLAVTSDFIKTITIPGKSSVPPAGLALATVTPFRTNAQAKTQIAYTATELKTTYGWKAGDVIESISIEVNSISGGAGPSTYSGLRIMAYLRNAPVSFPFPPPANSKIACMPGDAQNLAGWPKVIFGPGSTTLNMPMATAGTQAGGNYATFNLIPGVLVWDGVSNLVLSFENWTSIGLAPAKNYVLYNESSPTFNVCAINYFLVTGGAVNGQNICGPNTYYNPGLIVGGGATAVVSNQRPRLDFKLNRPYLQFPITVGGDWINNNRNIRTTVYSTTPLYTIAGDSGFIASNSRVIFDPTGRSGVNSLGLNSANAAYYTGIPGALLPADIDQDITSAVTSGGNSTVFGALEIKKASATAKSVRQVSAFTPWLTGNYADTLYLTTGELKLNRKEFVLRKPTTSALVLNLPNAWLRSEDNAAPAPGTIESKFKWQIGSGTTGIYNFPFKGPGVNVFSVIYNKTVAADDIGDLTIATYGTVSNNTPLTYPSLPVGNPLRVMTMTTNPTPIVDATPWTIDRFWLIDRSSAGAITGTITFEYDNVEATSTANYVAGEMKAQYYSLTGAVPGWNAPVAGQSDGTGGGKSWVVHPASFIDPTYNIWTILHTNASQAPLPIDLVNFNAKAIDRKVKIWWDVQSESDVAKYNVERTTDNTNFDVITVKAPVGPSTSLLSYDAWDNQPLNGLQYYRLATNFTDGTVDYSKLVPVRFNSNGSFAINNVVTNENSSLTVNFTYDSQLPYTYLVTDMMGRVVATGENKNAVIGDNAIVIPVVLSNGIYTISLVNSEKVVSQKMFY